MKKCLVLLTLFTIGLFCNNCIAQVTDPLNQGKKVTDKWSSEDEQVITKKKKNTDNNSNTTVIINESVPEKNIEILNSCPDDLSVELISLTGVRASQKVTITIKYINHGVNATMRVKNFLAYNEEGNEFSSYFPATNDTFTDVPVKAQWEIGQMLPSKNSKLPALSFMINDCTIEMRNVPIEWR